jgi:hypothetical protein
MDKRSLRTNQFYNSKYKKNNKYIYESEVFIVYYHCYKVFFNINGVKNMIKFIINL